MLTYKNTYNLQALEIVHFVSSVKCMQKEYTHFVHLQMYAYSVLTKNVHIIIHFANVCIQHLKCLQLEN